MSSERLVFRKQNKSLKLRYLAFIILFGSILFFQFSLQLQSNNQEKRKEIPLQHEVVVALKLVQVYVTDKKGKPVPDLIQSDFEINDNGKIMPFSHFEKHVVSLPETAAVVQETALSPEAVPKIGRKFFLFFDLGFSDPNGIIKAKKAGLHFVDTQVQPSDEVGVISYSTSKLLTLHEYLTTNHKKVRQVVEGLSVFSGIGRAEKLEDYFLSRFMEEIGRDDIKAEFNENEFLARLVRERSGFSVDENRRSSYMQQIANFSVSIKNLAQSLRYIPGAKNIVFFSGGISKSALYGTGTAADIPEDPFVSHEAIVRYSNALEGAYPDSGLLKNYEGMIQELKASNCNVYTVDISRNLNEANVDNLGSMTLVRRTAGGEDSLKQLSSQTGGKYYGNTMDYRKIVEDIQNTTGAYYVLGYSIDEKWDGKYHKIKVKVKRKGCEVYGQGGYFNPKPFKDYTGYEKLLHIIDLALSDNPQFQAPIELPSIALPVFANGETRFMAVSQIPQEKLQDISGPQTEMITLVFDEQSNVRILEGKRVNFSEAGQDKFYPYAIHPLPPGKYYCRIVLRNLETGRAARASSVLLIPESVGSGLRLYPPLLLKIEQNSKFIQGSKNLSLFDLYPFNSSYYAPIFGELSAGIPTIFAAVRCSGPSLPSPEVNLTAHLIDLLSGDAIPVSLNMINRSRENQTQICFVELALGKLRPGRYTLYFIAHEANGTSKSQTATIFTVK